VPDSVPEVSSGIFYKESRKQLSPAPVPPLPQEPVQHVTAKTAEQLGGMLNGLVGNVFENNNWWLWAAVIIIFLNPDLRKKIFGKEKEADSI
jgi:hypothetical protein